MSSPKQPSTWLPLAIAASVVIGLFLGSRFSGQKYNADYDRKLNMILNLISDDYVDTMKIADLVELTIPELLKNLDPHTTYFTADELKQANEDLDGKFSGIGISFMLMNDSINIIEIISGGPAEKAGLMAGDRIVTINDSTCVGKNISDVDVKNRIRGVKDSVVKLGIKRNNSKKLLHFVVKRGDIPVNSIDASYMLDKQNGYIKVNKFGRTTYDEFLSSLIKLKSEGAKNYIVDLRGNGGGIMEADCIHTKPRQTQRLSGVERRQRFVSRRSACCAHRRVFGKLKRDTCRRNSGQRPRINCRLSLVWQGSCATTIHPTRQQCH